MADKVQKIRKEIEIVINRRLNLLNGDQFDLNKEVDGFTNEIMDIIDSLQEEPVSIWHNMDEIPIKGEVIVVQTKDTFYGISVQKGGTTYKNRNKDRYVRWAYASDLLNLSNVERTVKDWKEPVSEDLEEASRNYADNEEYGDDVYFAIKAAFKVGSKWQKDSLWKPADGNDLPIIDREVIALLDNGKVVFAHRPPEYWDGKNIITGKVTRNYPKTYGKGGWNIPNVKYWLDCLMPKEIEL